MLEKLAVIFIPFWSATSDISNAICSSLATGYVNNTSFEDVGLTIKVVVVAPIEWVISKAPGALG